MPNMAPSTDPKPPSLIDTIAIVFGVVGTLLNALLFLVLTRNSAIDKKCCVLYKNLAAVDMINSLVIPLCYLTLDGHGYQIDVTDSKVNGVLYLLFGATINIPYIMLILLSLARVFIFLRQDLYTQWLSLSTVRVTCVVCWFLSLVLLGGWIVRVLSGHAQTRELVVLLKSYSTATVILALTTIILVIISSVIVQFMICRISRGETTPLLASRQLLTRELASARRTFILFFWSILTFSSYPIAFSATFVACGPYYNSTTGYCQHFLTRHKIFTDPKTSYAVMLLFLCSMSIANSLILLTQRSFRGTIASWFSAGRGTVQVEAEENTPPVILSSSPGSGEHTRTINQTIDNMD